MPEIDVLGIRYQNVTIEEARDDFLEFARQGGSQYVVTPNPEISETCRINPELRQAVEAACYAIPDGIGVVMASKICGTPLKERVGGFDLACSLFPAIEREGLTLYLLGAKPGVAQKASENIRSHYPSIRIVGTHDGYFQEETEVIDEINRIHPDILFVALGSPKQEVWMYRNCRKLNAGVMLGLGGSFDVFAGIVKRAPEFFIKMNLEWFYRLIRQPTRFVRMLKLPRYLMRAFSCRLKHIGGQAAGS